MQDAAGVDAAGPAIQRPRRCRSCIAAATTPPELLCSSHDVAGATMQRPRRGRVAMQRQPELLCSGYDAAGAAMQRSSTLVLRQLDFARLPGPRGYWNLERREVTSGRRLPHGAARVG